MLPKWRDSGKNGKIKTFQNKYIDVESSPGVGSEMNQNGDFLCCLVRNFPLNDQNPLEQPEYICNWRAIVATYLKGTYARYEYLSIYLSIVKEVQL